MLAYGFVKEALDVSWDKLLLSELHLPYLFILISNSKLVWSSNTCNIGKGPIVNTCFEFFALSSVFRELV